MFKKNVFQPHQLMDTSYEATFQNQFLNQRLAALWIECQDHFPWRATASPGPEQLLLPTETRLLTAGGKETANPGVSSLSPIAGRSCPETGPDVAGSQEAATSALWSRALGQLCDSSSCTYALGCTAGRGPGASQPRSFPHCAPQGAHAAATTMEPTLLAAGSGKAANSCTRDQNPSPVHCGQQLYTHLREHGREGTPGLS